MDIHNPILSFWATIINSKVFQFFLLLLSRQNPQNSRNALMTLPLGNFSIRPLGTFAFLKKCKAFLLFKLLLLKIWAVL